MTTYALPIYLIHSNLRSRHPGYEPRIWDNGIRSNLSSYGIRRIRLPDDDIGDEGKMKKQRIKMLSERFIKEDVWTSNLIGIIRKSRRSPVQSSGFEARVREFIVVWRMKTLTRSLFMDREDSLRFRTVSLFVERSSMQYRRMSIHSVVCRESSFIHTQ